ncbi:hypothetical protein ACJEKK_25410, partial [Escherichia coli]
DLREVRVQHQIVHDHALAVGPTGLAVWLLMACHQDRFGCNTLSPAEIATRLGQPVASIIDAQRRLANVGLLDPRDSHTGEHANGEADATQQADQ